MHSIPTYSTSFIALVTRLFHSIYIYQLKKKISIIKCQSSTKHSSVGACILAYKLSICIRLFF